MTATPTFDDISGRVRSHMPALDGLRGIAILLVIWYHVGLAGGSTDTLAARLFVAGANAGWVGVQLFFVLSGFLITGILLDTRGTPHAWRNFIARRSLRIFPLYFAVLGIAFLLLPALGALPDWLRDDRDAQWWYWTYLSNWAAPFYIGGAGFAHLWSLGVEEQFYLLWPMAALTLAPRRVATVALGLVAVAVASRLALPHVLEPRKVGERAAYFFTNSRWDALAIGALVAVALRDRAWAPRLMRALPRLTLLTGAGVIALAIVGRGLSDASKGVETIGHTLIAAFFGWLIAACATGADAGQAGSRLVRSAPMRTIGKYSYGVYVFHLPVAHALRWTLGPVLEERRGLRLVTTLSLQLCLVFAVSFALALLSWHLLEGPALSLKRYFAVESVASTPRRERANAPRA